MTRSTTGYLASLAVSASCFRILVEWVPSLVLNVRWVRVCSRVTCGFCLTYIMVDVGWLLWLGRGISANGLFEWRTLAEMPLRGCLRAMVNVSVPRLHWTACMLTLSVRCMGELCLLVVIISCVVIDDLLDSRMCVVLLCGASFVALALGWNLIFGRLVRWVVTLWCNS